MTSPAAARREAGLAFIAAARRAREAEARADESFLPLALPSGLGAAAQAHVLEEPRFRGRLGARLAALAGAAAPPVRLTHGAAMILGASRDEMERLILDAGAALQAGAILALLRAEDQQKLESLLGCDAAPAARRFGAELASDASGSSEKAAPEALAESVRQTGEEALAAWAAAQPQSVAARAALAHPLLTRLAPPADRKQAARGAALIERIAAAGRQGA